MRRGGRGQRPAQSTCAPSTQARASATGSAPAGAAAPPLRARPWAGASASPARKVPSWRASAGASAATQASRLRIASRPACSVQARLSNSAAASVPRRCSQACSAEAAARRAASSRADSGTTRGRGAGVVSRAAGATYSSSTTCALAPPAPKELTPARSGCSAPSITARSQAAAVAAARTANPPARSADWAGRSAGCGSARGRPAPAPP